MWSFSSRARRNQTTVLMWMLDKYLSCCTGTWRISVLYSLRCCIRSILSFKCPFCSGFPGCLLMMVTHPKESSRPVSLCTSSSVLSLGPCLWYVYKNTLSAYGPIMWSLMIFKDLIISLKCNTVHMKIQSTGNKKTYIHFLYLYNM